MARTVLITGTSTGIGAACVERMAAEGWTVYAGVRRETDGERLERAVAGDVRPVLLDVTDRGQLADVVTRLEDELGARGLDGLVNNAGVPAGGPIEILSDDEWREHFEINVFGLVAVTRELLPLLRRAKGRVVNIGSISGRVSAPLLAPYSAGKHAVEAISESLRVELADAGMSVACVEPGEIKTEIWTKADQRLEELEDEIRSDGRIEEHYRRYVEMLYGFTAEGAKRGTRAEKVAGAVAHALTADRPKHRYLVGPDAKLVGVVSRLPDRIRASILAANMGRWERSGRKLRQRQQSPSAR